MLLLAQNLYFVFNPVSIIGDDPNSTLCYKNM